MQVFLRSNYLKPNLQSAPTHTHTHTHTYELCQSVKTALASQVSQHVADVPDEVLLVILQ